MRTGRLQAAAFSCSLHSSFTFGASYASLSAYLALVFNVTAPCYDTPDLQLAAMIMSTLTPALGYIVSNEGRNQHSIPVYLSIL